MSCFHIIALDQQSQKETSECWCWPSWCYISWSYTTGATENQETFSLQCIQQRLSSTRYFQCLLCRCCCILYTKTDTLQGKSLAEKSALMAQAWRQMDTTAKAKYCQEGEDDDISETEDLSIAKKRKLIMRVAKRHQGDVCYFVRQKVPSYLYILVSG